MILSNRVKSFLLVLVLLTFCFGCRFWQNLANTNTSSQSGAFPEDKSNLPFSTREPDIYQARIVVTAGGVQRATFAAKNGAKRRCEYNFGEKGAAVWVRTDKDYLLLPDKRIFTEQVSPPPGPTPSEGLDALTVEWLNIKAVSKFEDLGMENGLKKFSAKLNESDASEVLLFIDEASGLPVKQEYYSIKGDQRDLLYSVELQGLRLDAGDDLFTIPKDYRKVSVEEFRVARMTK
jgi:hypothetical protein